MPNLLVRDLPSKIVIRLKARAKQHGRSLQGEVKAILEEAAKAATMDEFRQIAERWQRRLGTEGRRFSDSAELIREDRDR
jgi:plasmid stability protein